MSSESTNQPTSGISDSSPSSGSANPTDSSADVTMASTPPEEQHPKTGALQRQPSVSDPNMRSCFICLLNSEETPGSSWVNPCPCTLEAHESCMLRWVAESEGSRSAPKKLLCPACQAKIQVIEPWDAVVKLGEKFHRLYSRASPALFAALLSGMSIGGQGAYGWACMTAFAGHRVTLKWLGMQRWLEDSQYSTGIVVLGKWFLLGLIGPGLLLHKVLPSLTSVVAVPASLIYGAVLAVRGIPASLSNPAWALTLMPYVSISYSHVYYLFFGGLERRLNRALKGRPPEEPAAAHGAEGNGENEAQDEGIGTALLRLGGALVNLFDVDGEIVVEVEAGVNQNDDLEGEIPVELEVVFEDREEALQEIERAGAAGGHNGTIPPDEDAEAQERDQAQPDDVVQQVVVDQAGDGEPQQDQNAPAADAAQNQNNNNDNDNNNQAGDENRPTTTLSDVVNGIVSQLLFPLISAGIGEALRQTLPRDWVTTTKPGRPASLLQQRWGRSLAGGCLFVVLKDAFRLYSKFRRVEVKKQRKVKNVARRDRASVTAP